ncbi:Inositol-pentakisphosphate 2-kinase [Onygenales sp. PD_40]|nr:Inositol-pentakisphosphate 2-kinase [Onygenales sp. PD_40]KAK2799565.1 Inositol-pentakisphosphate 2-kinase [Onygenales sp. PD_10]
MGHLDSDTVAAHAPRVFTLYMANQIPELPVGVRPFYLAEGGANIVYKITMPNELSIHDKLKGGRQLQPDRKLLRLRKQIDSGTPYQDTVRNFNGLIRPMFRDDELVDQTLVRLPKSFILHCNEQLRADEAHDLRPKNRSGVYLSPKEPFGLLITDMTPISGSGTCLWEFKPKWLLQSPSAPPNAKRCRTCALREMKNYDARKAGAPEKQSFCPLDLVSDKFEDVLRATRFIKGGHGRARVAEFLYRNATLLKLQACQRRMNAVGLPGLQAHFRERAISMTLRDCTMFVKVPHSELEPLEVRLGDLDFKSGIGGKLQYWRETENRLIEEGWYSGNRRGQEYSECSLQGPRDDYRPSLKLVD